MYCKPLPALGLSLLALALVCASAFAQTVTTTYEFNDRNGRYPQYFMFTQGKDGNVIGTTESGGSVWGRGFVYRQRPGTGTVNVLYDFANPDGSGGYSGVTIARDGNYYGTLAQGGQYNAGSLYRVFPGGVFTSLHAFTGGSDGAQPYAPPIEGSDGNLYGTTTGGGITNSTIYKYTSQGVFSVLYTFPGGVFLTAPLLEWTDGNFYVPIGSEGTYGCGEILKMSKLGQVLSTHSFDCAGNGWGPVGQLIQANDGFIYGATAYGGLYNHGVVYKLDPNSGLETVLHNFGSTPSDGYQPEWSGVSQGSDGNLYGATSHGGDFTCGTLYQVSPSGSYTQLYSFSSTSFGCPYPAAAPFQDTNGKFFGGTFYGGSYGFGTLYTLDMGLPGFVSFIRAQGHVGAIAQILGQGLTGTTSVTFNNVPAHFTVLRDTYMTATVPSGATTGPVVVTTPTGPLTSNTNFRITQ